MEGGIRHPRRRVLRVANEPQRDRVRALLDAAGVRTKVAVYPPWFAAPA